MALIRNYLRFLAGLGVIAFCIIVGFVGVKELSELIISDLTERGIYPQGNVPITRISMFIGLFLGSLPVGFLGAQWARRWINSRVPGMVARNVSPLDRNHWAQKVGEDTLRIVDDCLSMVCEYRTGLDTEYGSHLISALDSASGNRIVSFIPTKKFIKVSGKPTEKEAWVKRLQAADIHIESGPKSRTVLRLVVGDMEKNESLLREFFQSCCERLNT